MSRRVGMLSSYTTFSYYGREECYPGGRPPHRARGKLEAIQTGVIWADAVRTNRSPARTDRAHGM